MTDERLDEIRKRHVKQATQPDKFGSIADHQDIDYLLKEVMRLQQQGAAADDEVETLGIALRNAKTRLAAAEAVCKVASQYVEMAAVRGSTLAPCHFSMLWDRLDDWQATVEEEKTNEP